jgi:alpha-aminoadipate carrier protein LysW
LEGFLFYTYLKEIIKMVTCPECGAEFDLPEGTVLNEIIVCPECGIELEVTSLNPPEVEEAPMEEEDWGE